MSSITYQILPGPVGECLKPASYSTTATVPVSPTTSLVFTTGHIGLDLNTGELVNSSIEAEFSAIYDCLDAALKNAGVTGGLFHAYKFVSFLLRAEDERVMQEVFRKRFPGHSPTWTTVVVKGVLGEGMSAEIAAEGVLFAE
ncbi:hypothetical protein ASPWEDRAFT_44885 [Aspergillus wentii DTO 134E9]|uniref:YjgF-like protein n=1 Tax=Aspergillus wentii DTO 134E9 TaxID=1073089 RepID=A0A1L9R7M7_ASPWE|nr:uncharacterized protein ASPWEDRAFT_44885 [Aspergillus wentii DTO 134E9]OJJ30926.1 hypothetical protein ASPWEDRAFT_44885 [Aspergillus wentii DTO 134E9]